MNKWLMSLLLFVAFPTQSMLINVHALAEKRRIVAQEASVYVQKFPSMTWNGANYAYQRCSGAVRKKIVESVKAVDDEKGNKMFSTAFYLATQCSVDIRNKIVSKDLRYLNESEINPLVENRPIGESIYRYEWARAMSRGKLVTLPMCHPILEKCGVISSWSVKRKNGLLTGYNWSDEIGWFVETVVFDDNDQIKQMTNIDGLLATEERTQYVLDCAMEVLSHCIKDEILALFDFHEKRFLSKKKLYHLLSLDKKHSFILPHCKDEMIYYRKNYTHQNCVDFVVDGAKSGMKSIFPVLAIPLTLIGLSRLIETQCCEKKFVEAIAINNDEWACSIHKLEEGFKSSMKHLKGFVDEKGLRDHNLTMERYRQGIQDPLQYNEFDKIIINLARLSLPACIVPFLYSQCSDEPNKVKKIAASLSCGVCMSVGLNTLLNPCFVENPKTFAVSLCAAGAFSLGAGAIYNVLNEFFSDNSTINGTVKPEDIEELLEREDIEIL